MSTNKIISQIEAEQMEKELPEFGPGDTVVVQVKVKEGNRERLQAFEGVCIAKRNRALNSAFTVRKISHGVAKSAHTARNRRTTPLGSGTITIANPSNRITLDVA